MTATTISTARERRPDRCRSTGPADPGAADEEVLSRWVDAAPFRAHLIHLMAAGGMTSDMVAVLAGVSPALTQRLLSGRRGRPVRRISPLTATKLFQVTPSLVRSARRRQVPAGEVRPALLRLRAAGWSDPELAQLLRLSAVALSDLGEGRATRCSQWVALGVAAAELRLHPWAIRREAASRVA